MKLRHVMILASAGSGKTYALTNRFVALLAAGASPERVVALTFTRKAAGEFFDEILNKLAHAASDEAFAGRLARDIDFPELRTADFRQLLRRVVDAMPQLRLGTLDGFFARIARAFPLELGLTGEFEVLLEHTSQIERQRVLQRMFAHAAGGLEAAQREFIEAFKRATFGTEEKRLAARLDGFLDEYQENFLAAPDRACWGEPERIWPQGCAWLVRSERSLTEAALALQHSLAARGLPEKQQARWDAFFTGLPEWLPGAPLPRAVEYILQNALAVWDELVAGAAEMIVGRQKLALGPVECRDVVAIVRHLVGAELTRRLEVTRGIHAVLRSYEAVYDETVRRVGRLTFGDVQRLLLPERGSGWGDAQDADHRMLIDYRLDGHFDHWLLDEFQDTSHGQWRILRNLIDEVVQDPTGERTFFCVGDVKQAIYTWREGDPRLFREIYEHYNHAVPGTIVEQHLDRSWRSGPAIIEMVNAVFGRAEVLTELFSGEASTTWNREWRAHESAQPHLAGQAAWLHAPDEEARFALTLRLLQEIAPLERGLECAVLTQTNNTATLLADYLRREGGIPALAESDLHVATDNPLGAALLALVQAAAHPGDTLAQEHVRMTPLARILAQENMTTPEALSLGVLERIHRDGFERMCEFWLRRLEETEAVRDAFTRERGRQFLVGAALFDSTGSRSVAEFVAFMERHVARAAEVAGVVRVMTVHKSKGLGFDVVLLPDLEGTRIDQRREGLAVQRGADRSVAWVLDLPSKLFHAQDPVLSAHVDAAEAEACYEAFALLYVAMTRAKRAMYAITKAPGASESRNYPKLLAATLGAGTRAVSIGSLVGEGGWSTGDPAWHARLPRRAADPAASLGSNRVPLLPAGATRVTRRPARRPSASISGAIPAGLLFSLQGGQGAEFGNQVHTLLATIERGGTLDSRSWIERGFLPAVIEEVQACLAAPELREIWAPPVSTEVWRERAFEIVLDGAWVTGVFDRVMIERDQHGAAQWVTVLDFKTDRLGGGQTLPEAARRHAAQLNLYRRVAAALAGVSLHAVTCELVFTQVQRRVRVEAD